MVRESKSHLARRESIVATNFQLSSGQILEKIQISFSVQGPQTAPLVIVLGGISATRDVASAPHPQKPWWSHVFDASSTEVLANYRVFSMDFLGASGSSFGPTHQEWEMANAPTISTADQARALKYALDHLGRPPIKLFVGASYGGMVALKFASIFPKVVERYLVISAAHRSAPLAVAWRTLQRRILELGKKAGLEEEGVHLARALAMASYRTPEEFTLRFGGPESAGLADERAPVWQYLSARGKDYAKSMHPDAFFTLSHSIDTHEVNPELITDPLHILAVNEDQLVPYPLLKELADSVQGDVTLQNISSIYGHDAFLKETPVIQNILNHTLCC